MKVCVKKEVCGSCEQCTRPTDRHISVQNLLVKEVMGPVHGAWDPLTDNIHMKTPFSIKKRKNKKKKKTQMQKRCPETQTKRFLNK